MAIGLTALTGQVIESAEAVAASSIEWASDTGGTPLSAGSGERFQSVNIQVSVDFHASSTEDAVLHLRKSSDGGTTENTEGEMTKSLTIPNPGDGSTVTRSISVFDFAYLDVGMENLDSGQVIEGWSAKWEGVKITGMATS